MCTDRPVAPALPAIERGIDGLRIATAGGYFGKGAFPEALTALERVAKALAVKRENSAERNSSRAIAAGWGGLMLLILLAAGAAFYLRHSLVRPLARAWRR